MRFLEQSQCLLLISFLYFGFGLGIRVELASNLIEVISPGLSAVFVTIPPSTTASVPVEFQIIREGREIPTDSLVCLSLYTKQRIVFQNQCVPSSNNVLQLNNLSPEKYSLEMSMFSDNQAIPDGKTETEFEIVTMESSLPLLQAPPDQTYLANLQTDASDASFEYSLAESSLNKYLQVCVEVTPLSGSKYGLERSCLPSDQHRVNLYNIPAGFYQLHLELQMRSTPHSFPTSRMTSSIHIHRIQDILPSLLPDHVVLEAGVAANEVESGQISLGVTTILHPSFSHAALLSHLDTCLVFSPSDNSEPAILCAATSPHQEFSLSRLPRGTHSYSLTLRSHHQPDTTFPQSTVEGKVVVSNMTEFVPSYDWKELKPWHTIPSGLETRLPVGSGARKEARIPQPWRLQTSMPRPCKYFLRMDISRSTTIGQIRSAAATKCQKPLECFQIIVGGNEVEDDHTTSESINLFSQVIELNFLSNELCDPPRSVPESES